ncbi:MAG: DUF4258 domain-containing protein [Thermodesulfobacteriota bacterium]
MSLDRESPSDPLDFIQHCVREGKVFWTYHVTMRLRERSISRRVVLESVDAYEIIEENPEDKYLPSYLVYAAHEGTVFHLLFATDVHGGNVRVITVYRPSLQDWEEDLKIRRRSS